MRSAGRVSRRSPRPRRHGRGARLRAAGSRPAAPDVCLDAGDQLVEPDRLGQEVVRPGGERAQDRVIVARAGHQQDRQGAAAGPLSEGPDDIDPRHPGHGHVEQDDGRPDRIDEGQRLLAARGRNRRERGTPKGHADEAEDLLVIVDDEDAPVVPGTGRHARRRSGITRLIASSSSREATGLLTNTAPCIDSREGRASPPCSRTAARGRCRVPADHPLGEVETGHPGHHHVGHEDVDRCCRSAGIMASASCPSLAAMTV